MICAIDVGVVGAVDGWTDDVGVDGRGEDGAPGAAGGEQRGHAGDRNEVPRGEAREEEEVQGLLLRLISCSSSHGVSSCFWRNGGGRMACHAGDRETVAAFPYLFFWVYYDTILVTTLVTL